MNMNVSLSLSVRLTGNIRMKMRKYEHHESEYD